MKKAILYIALVAFLALPAEQALASSNTLWSTTIGAALGGTIGSTIGKGRGNVAATAAGVFVGGAIGNSIGRSMDRAPRHAYAPRPVHYYAPVYRTYRPNYVAPAATQDPDIIYRDQRRSHRYERPRLKRVERGYMSDHPHNRRKNGRHCREFTQTIRIDGQVKESVGIACLRPDGSWQVQ